MNTVPCVVCGHPAEVIRHEYCEGSAERPARRWSVEAPLYYASSPDRMGIVAGFCSAECGLVWAERGKARP